MRFALKEVLASRGLSQAEFARRTGFVQPEISRWCKGQRLPSVSNLNIIIKNLGCDVDEILVGGTSKRAGKGMRCGRPHKKCCAKKRRAA